MKDEKADAEPVRMKVNVDALPVELFAAFAETVARAMEDLVLVHDQQVKFLSLAFRKMYVQGGEDALLAAVAVPNRRSHEEEEGNADSQEQTSPSGQKVKVH